MNVSRKIIRKAKQTSHFGFLSNVKRWRSTSPIRNSYIFFKRRSIRGKIFVRKRVFINGRARFIQKKSRPFRNWGPPTRTRFPPIKDAKLICDYLVYYLNKRVRIYRLFSNLRYWQWKEFRVTNTLKYYAWVESDILSKKYPLAGIRILCAGSPKKGGRKRRNHYHLWIRNQRLTREMPLQKIEVDIDYFSSNTHVTTGTNGVKVWLCFSTISYKFRSRENKYYI